MKVNFTVYSVDVCCRKTVPISIQDWRQQTGIGRQEGTVGMDKTHQQPYTCWWVVYVVHGGYDGGQDSRRDLVEEELVVRPEGQYLN